MPLFFEFFTGDVLACAGRQNPPPSSLSFTSSVISRFYGAFATPLFPTKTFFQDEEKYWETLSIDFFERLLIFPFVILPLLLEMEFSSKQRWELAKTTISLPSSSSSYPFPHGVKGSERLRLHHSLSFMVRSLLKKRRDSPIS